MHLEVQSEPDALRLVLYEIYRHLGPVELDRLASTLAGAPARAEYLAMVEHSQVIADRRAATAYQNSPAYSEARKAERAKLHAQRLAAKALRDAARNKGEMQ